MTGYPFPNQRPIKYTNPTQESDMCFLNWIFDSSKLTVLDITILIAV
jgi:hypothetical protein